MSENWILPVSVFLPDCVVNRLLLSYFVRCGGTLTKETDAKAAGRFLRFQKVFFFIVFIVGITWFTNKTTFRCCFFFLYYFADSFIYRGGCPCSFFGNLFLAYFMKGEKTDDEMWVAIGLLLFFIVLGILTIFSVLRTGRENPGTLERLTRYGIASVSASKPVEVRKEPYLIALLHGI